MHEVYQESSSSSPRHASYTCIAKSLNPFPLRFFFLTLLLVHPAPFPLRNLFLLRFFFLTLLLVHLAPFLLQNIFPLRFFSFSYFCWCILVLSRSAFSFSCFCWCILLRRSYFSLRFSCPDVLLTLLESLHANFFLCVLHFLFYSVLYNFIIIFCRRPDHLFPLLKFCSSTADVKQVVEAVGFVTCVIL